MRTLTVLLCLGILFAYSNAQTNVSGSINKDSTWTRAGSPYIVSGSVTVNSPFKLTVDSGVVVRFTSGTYLYINGALQARQATFTSRKDTAGGSPAKGDWASINFNSGATTAQLDTCQIRYGGGTAMINGTVGTATIRNCSMLNSSTWGASLTATTVVFANNTVSGSTAGGVYISATTSTLSNCTVSSSGSHGIQFNGGTNTLTNCNITNSGNLGVYVQSGSLMMTGCTIATSVNAGVYFEQGTNVTVNGSTFTSTLWPLWYNGQASLILNGTNIFSSNTHNGIYVNFSGTVADFVLDTASIPFVFPYEFTVNSGNTMTVASSDVLKFSGGHLNINGALNAIAGLGQSIYFTSYRNDNLPTPGSDTNGDGLATVPHWGDWGGVVFNDASVDGSCVMRRCNVSFAGSGNIGGITMYNASPTIDGCDMSNNYFGVMMQYVSNPIFTNNTIGSSQLVPIAMAFTANPVFNNNTFSNSDNQYDALGLLGGTLTANAVLPIRKVVRIVLGTPDSISNITYLLLDQVTVPVGMTMTINKGVVIKGYAGNQRLVIQGKLVANATPDSMIVFTSAKDDNFGRPNDTNKDGNITVPGRGDWGGITFESGSDSTSIINYAQLHFGALPYYYYYFNGVYLSGGGITTINLAKPTISNSIIGEAVYGLYVYGTSNPVITNTKIVNSQYTPVAMSIPAEPAFVADTFINSGWTALGIIGENLGASGTLHQRTVSGYTNITYVLLSDLTINSGTTVTINAGVVLKSAGAGIYVNGALHAKGTIAGGNVVFTSIKDDNYGNPGDSNRDGNASAPAAGDWSTIRFQATSDDVISLLDSCLINYAGNGNWGAVTYTDAGSTLSNSTIFKSNAFGIRCENSSTPTIYNVTFTGCRLDPVAMSLQSNPTFTDPITFSANGSRGIHILEGTLSSNATLAQRSFAGITNIAYIIDNLTINSNAVLTILPGVVIKYSSYYNGILVNGALVAKGTNSQKIVFTSLPDDSKGGDTNNDGNGSTPGKGNWSVIDFTASSLDTLNVLRNCEFRYGGSNVSNEYGLVRVYNAALILDSCTISQSASSALGIFGSGHPTFSNTQIDNISLTPVTMSMFSTPTFANMTALNVGYMAIGIKPETYSITSTIPIRNFAGYTNITYLLYGTNTINTGTTITIPAGIVFKDGNWVVNGALVTSGTPTQNVVFTDSRDDSYGHPGDTNGDGAATTPAIQGFQRITFNDVSLDSASLLKNTVFRFTDGAVYLVQASPKILDCLFNSDNWGVYLTGVSNPSIDSCTFNNLVLAPMRISLVSYPSSTSGDVISGTTFKGIGVLEGETLVQDVTLTRKSFAGINNIPYIFGNYTVANNSVLTINPGLIIKFFPTTSLTIRKGLIAEGTSNPDSTTVFTDLRDDFYGNDTNSDSTLSNPTSYTSAPFYWYPGWYGINFTNESLAPFCRLRNVVIRYAGLSNSGAAITTTSASPTITLTAITNNYNAIVANGASNPVVNNCDIDQNANWGINNVNKSFTINAQNNWWGSNTGPTHSGNPGGTGQSVTDAVNYSPFTTTSAQDPLSGDVSLNGQIQAYDASLILKWIVNSVTDPLNTNQQRVADVSGNGSIAALDASLILQEVAGKISIFPVEFQRKISSDPSVKPSLAVSSTATVSGSWALHTDKEKITLSGREMNNVYAADIVLSYDKNQLTPVSINPVGLAANSMTAFSIQDGVIKIELASADALSGTGDLFQIQYQVVEGSSGSVLSPVAFTKFQVNEIDMKSFATDGSVAMKNMPTSFALDQNYPNPFNPSTNINYQVPENGRNVRIDIFNITGQLVRTLVNKTHNAGEYNVVWDGTNDVGQQVSSGVYFFRMASTGFVNTKKMVLMK